MIASRLLLAACLASLALVAPARADDFPTRPVKLVMGFGAVGLGDIAGRATRPSTPEALQKIYDEDVARWRKVITEAKIAPQ